MHKFVLLLSSLFMTSFTRNNRYFINAGSQYLGILKVESATFLIHNLYLLVHYYLTAVML